MRQTKTKVEAIESIAKIMEHTIISTTQAYAKVTNTKISEDMDRLMERRKRIACEKNRNQVVM